MAGDGRHDSIGHCDFISLSYCCLLAMTDARSCLKRPLSYSVSLYKLCLSLHCPKSRKGSSRDLMPFTMDVEKFQSHTHVRRAQKTCPTAK